MICRNTYNKKFCRPMIPCKAMTKHLDRNSEKRFLECTKKGLRNIFRHFFHSIFFMFVLLVSRSGSCNFSLKKSLVQINSKLNEKNRMITYTNIFARERLVLTHHVGEYSPAKTGVCPRMFPNFLNQ